MVCWLYFFAAFWEQPWSYNHESYSAEPAESVEPHAGLHDEGYSFSQDQCFLIHFLFILTMFVDTVLIFYVFDRDYFFKHESKTVQVLHIRIANFVFGSFLCAVGLLVDGMAGWALITLRLMRPFWIIMSASRCHVVARIMFQVLCDETVLSMLMVRMCWWFLASWCAHVMFIDYDQSFSSTLLQLWIMLTTANFPDAMMPMYNDNQNVVYFYGTFVGVGVFILLPMLLAVVYKVYSAKLGTHYERRHELSHANFGKAFDLFLEGDIARIKREHAEGEFHGDGLVRMSADTWCHVYCNWFAGLAAPSVDVRFLVSAAIFPKSEFRIFHFECDPSPCSSFQNFEIRRHQF